MSLSRALEFTLQREGGYHAPDEHDPIETNFGITQPELTDFNTRHPDLGLPSSVKDLTIIQAQKIYALDYWTPSHAADLPEPLDMVHFDTAVNSGVHEAATLLQQACQVTTDGEIGPVTLAAAKENVPLVIDNYLWDRLDFDRVVAQRHPEKLAELPGWVLRLYLLHGAAR